MIHLFTLSPDQDPLAPREPDASLKRAKINDRILMLVADFVTAQNLNCRQGASSAIHVLITQLIEIGASLPREHPDATSDVLSLVDRITEKTIGQAILQNADDRLRQALGNFAEFKFVSLVVDAGMVHHLKTIPFLLANPYHITSPFLLALYENQNLTKQQYSELFEGLIRMVGSSGLTLCSILIDNLPAQSAGLDEILLRSASNRSRPLSYAWDDRPWSKSSTLNAVGFKTGMTGVRRCLSGMMESRPCLEADCQ
jgi:hypothetical protein